MLVEVDPTTVGFSDHGKARVRGGWYDIAAAQPPPGLTMTTEDGRRHHWRIPPDGVMADLAELGRGLDERHQWREGSGWVVLTDAVVPVSTFTVTKRDGSGQTRVGGPTAF